MELNASVSKDTPILIRVDGNLKKVTFDFFEPLFKNSIEFEGGEYVKVDGIEVLTINKKTKKAEWGRVTYVIRHKVDEILEIQLEDGSSINLTGNHSVMVLRGNSLVEKSAFSLKPGDKLLMLASVLASGEKSKSLGDLVEVEITKVKTKPYHDYVYDVSVPGNEMFFAGESMVLLHNSDERGIQTIREKIKDFARTAPVANAPFKIIFLDEADALTRDAQQALRRIMEKYSTNVRFILSCNYSSKIIDPIQSRCAIFRFKPLGKEDILQLLKKIAEKEGLKVQGNALEIIAEISEGDARRAVNLLQAIAAASEVITPEKVYEIASVAKPEEIKEILKLAFEGRFIEARDKLFEVMVNYGMSAVDMVKQLMKGVWTLPISDDEKVSVIDRLGEVEFRIVEGSNPSIQLEAFLAYVYLLGSKKK